MRKVGVALGGGGARGLAHVGILNVFEKEKVPVHCIAGTSMGAIVGACYAVNPDSKVLEAKITQILKSPLLHRMRFHLLKADRKKEDGSILSRAQQLLAFSYLHIVEETKNSLLPLESLEKAIALLLPDIDIAQTKIPFACVATDLTNGTAKVFTEGPLRRCVLASASIPGIFPPVDLDGVYYNDGGSVSVSPVRAAKKLGADFVIACDVKSRITQWEKPEKAKEIVARCNYITGILLNELQLKESDVVVSPNVKDVRWNEFDRYAELFSEGEKATRGKVPEIRALMRIRTFWGRFSRFLGLSSSGASGTPQ
jgi:NTE family protein